MSFGNTFENDLLALILLGTPIANIADNAAASPLTNLYLALHTADPGEAGDQTTSEATYTGYGRVAVPRSTSGFTTPSAGSSSLAANRDFPTGTGGSGTATYFSLGTGSTGAGKIIMSGPITPNITTGSGITPRLTTATTFSID
jgi:hypothetical protein